MIIHFWSLWNCIVSYWPPHYTILYVSFNSGRGRITPSVFAGIQTQHVISLPFDIDGDQVFKLKYNAKNAASTLSDGRPWKDYYNSKRSGFTGIRRSANCKGSLRSPDEMGWYKKEYGKENRVKFEKQNGISVCHSCHTVPEDVICPAVKHTCVAVNKSISNELADELADDAAKAFQISRQVKPQRYFNDKIISAIETASCGDDVYEIATTFANNSTLNNIY